MYFLHTFLIEFRSKENPIASQKNRGYATLQQCWWCGAKCFSGRMEVFNRGHASQSSRQEGSRDERIHHTDPKRAAPLDRAGYLPSTSSSSNLVHIFIASLVPFQICEASFAWSQPLAISPRSITSFFSVRPIFHSLTPYDRHPLTPVFVFPK